MTGQLCGHRLARDPDLVCVQNCQSAIVAAQREQVAALYGTSQRVVLVYAVTVWNILLSKRNEIKNTQLNYSSTCRQCLFTLCSTVMYIVVSFDLHVGCVLTNTHTLPAILISFLQYSLQDGWTPLLSASFDGHQRVVELLLIAGANPDIQEKVRTTTTAQRVLTFVVSYYNTYD